MVYSAKFAARYATTRINKSGAKKRAKRECAARAQTIGFGVTCGGKQNARAAARSGANVGRYGEEADFVCSPSGRMSSVSHCSGCCWLRAWSPVATKPRRS